MPGRCGAPAAGAILVICLGLAACGSDDTGGGGAGDAAATTAAPATTAVPETTTSSTGADAEAVAVEVRDGQVVGGARRVRLDTGEVVRIEVTSDVADEVHVHGYDRSAEIEAGGRVVVELVADIPGLFEVELEDRKLELLELEVR